MKLGSDMYSACMKATQGRLAQSEEEGPCIPAASLARSQFYLECGGDAETPGDGSDFQVSSRMEAHAEGMGH